MQSFSKIKKGKFYHLSKHQSMQTFPSSRTNIPPVQTKRPVPGARIPGAQPVMRPAVPKTGFPTPMGAKAQIPMTGAPNQQIPPVSAPEEQQQPKSTVTREPPHNSPFEPKSELPKPDPPIRDKAPPQIPPNFPPKTETGPRVVTKEHEPIHPSHQTQPQPPITRSEFEPRQVQRFPGPRNVESRENMNDQTSDELARLSESLQAMKSLRNNFQGFNVEPEAEEQQEDQGEDQGEEQNEADYEGGEEDDYVRVEDTDADDVRQNANEEEQEDYENNMEYENQDLQDTENREEQTYNREEPPVVQNMHNFRVETQAQLNQRQQEYQAAEEADEVPEIFSAKARTPQRISEMKQLSPQLRSPQLRSPGVRQDIKSPNLSRPYNTRADQQENELQTNQGAAYTLKGEDSTHKSSDYERIEPGFKSDPSLLIQIQKLELELEKERKRNSILDNEHRRIIDENISLKSQNHQLTTKLEAASRREATDKSTASPELDALRLELDRAVAECRQSSQNANRIISETSQYKEETDSMINSLEDEKNTLYHQISDLRRQIDEEYVVQIEGFRQRINLLESRIQEYESSFTLVQDQLREKTLTLQRVTSLNTDVQAVLSSLPKNLSQPSSVSNLPQSHTSALPPQRENLPQAPKNETRGASTTSNQPQIQPNIHSSERKPSGNINTAPVVQQTRSVQQNLQNRGELTNQLKRDEVPKKQPVAYQPVSEQVQIVPGKTHEKLNVPETEEDKRLTPRKDALQRENPETRSRVNEEKKESSGSNTFGANVNQKSKAQGTGKNPFAEEESAEDFFNNLSANAQENTEGNQHQQQFETHHEEVQPSFERHNPLEEHPPLTQEKVSVSNIPASKTSKGNLRYSQNTATNEKDQNPISVEAAENFFEQLGSGQTHPPVSEPKTQTSVQRGQNPFAVEEEAAEEATQPYSQPQSQHQSQYKSQTLVQKGRNPFASEDTQEESNQSQTQLPPPVKTHASIQKGKNPFAEDTQEDLTKSQVQPPVKTHTPMQRGKNPFASEENHEDLTQSQVQVQPPVKTHTPMQRGKNPFASEDAQDESTPSNAQVQASWKSQAPVQRGKNPLEVSEPTQSQTLTQTRTAAPVQKGRNPFAEDSHSDLTQSQSQVQPPVKSHTPMQRGKNPFASEDTHEDLTQSRSQIQPPVKTHTPMQRGKNPFASEDTQEAPGQSTDFLQSSQNESFANRFEGARPAQAKINTVPLQTGLPKRVDVSLSKSSALKGAKGNIPSSMFN